MAASGAEQVLREAAGRKARASGAVPFSEEELDSAERSLRGIDSNSALPWDSYREFLRFAAHEPYHVWARTEEAATQLATVVGGPDDAVFQKLFARVLEDGGWAMAEAAARSRPSAFKPWVVLVTGLNGIRKTTATYQPWFGTALSQALGASFGGAEEELPTGGNSFFRQLDFMIATVALEEFRRLYQVSEVEPYAALKDSFFARYRKVAEALGILLVRQAQQRRMNIMVETSGRDVASYSYIDHLFPSDAYRKLVVHLTVNDVRFAQASVQRRMLKEMSDGRAALEGTALDVIQANAGGPYGPGALPAVQKASDEVWSRVQAGEAGFSWYKARLDITARDDAAWSLRAHCPDSTEFCFELRT